jgi:glycosyltransferase involved in cell wall biosynthesis
MNEQPLVSVVIPAFNAEAFVAEAIKSATAQDYGRVEVIVVDDGSTDATAAIASRHAVTVLMQENGGQAAARNAGVAAAAAAGTFVAFLDADDLWLPSMLSTEVAHLLAHPELDYVLVRMQRTLTPGAPWPPGTPASFFDDSQPGTLPSAGLVRREILDRVGRFDTGYRHGSDTEWQSRAADAGVRWALLPEVLVEYRIHGDNTSYDNLGMKREMFELLRASVARKRAAG